MKKLLFFVSLFFVMFFVPITYSADVILRHDNIVSIISVDTGELLKEFSVNGRVVSLYQDEQFIYVSVDKNENGHIIVLDNIKYNLVYEFEIEDIIYDFVKHDEKLYMSSAGRGLIFIYDENFQYVDVITLEDRYSACKLEKSDECFYAITYESIVIVDPNTYNILKEVEVPKWVGDVVIDDKNLYITKGGDNGNDMLSKYTVSGVLVEQVVLGSNLINAYDNEDHVFVSLYFDGHPFVFIVDKLSMFVVDMFRFDQTIDIDGFLTSNFIYDIVVYKDILFVSEIGKITSINLLNGSRSIFYDNYSAMEMLLVE